MNRAGRQLLLLGLSIAVASALAAAATAGGGPQQFGFHLLSNVQIDNPVEQQTPEVTDCVVACPWTNTTSLWVTNPYRSLPCAWDVDDHWQLGDTNGYLGPGASAVARACLVAEADHIYNTVYGLSAWYSNSPRRVSLNLAAPSASLSATICFSPQSQCFALVPRYDPGSHTFHYDGCALLSYGVGDPALGPVPNSVGIGVVTTATVTVANPTARKIAKIDGSLRVEGGYVAVTYCDFAAHPPQSSYPFLWSS